jgi:hypothetical protein
MHSINRIAFSLSLVLLCLGISACGEEQGTLKGTVAFRGLPCQPGQPDFRVPPCSGPYPSYEVSIFSPDDLESPLVTTMTDSRGTYELKLPVGEYLIMTQNGPQPDIRKENRFNILKDEVTALSLEINSGIL